MNTATWLMAWLILLSTVIITIPRCGVFGQKRECRSATTDFKKVPTELSHRTRVQLSSDNQTASLYVDVMWTVSNPENIPLDGFLIHFQKPLPRDKSLHPMSECDAGFSHMWVNTTDQDPCEKNSSSVPSCVADANIPDDFCLCLTENCSLIDYGCRGTPDLLSEFGNFRLAILPAVRNLTFAISFQENYVFYLSPYYREFTLITNTDRPPDQIEAVDDCVGMLREKYEYMCIEDIRTVCCQSGAKLVTAQNVGIDHAVPDFPSGTINKTIFWQPPAENATFWVEVYYPGGFLNATPQEAEITKMLLPSIGNTGNSDGDGNCSYNPTHVYRLVLYNLLPNKEYGVQIRTEFEKDNELAAVCDGHTRCTVTIDLNVEAIDPCAGRWNMCPSGTVCTIANETSDFIPTTLCVPSPTTPDTGTTPSRTYCVDSAQPVETEVNDVTHIVCICPNGTYGDGVDRALNGTGCEGCPAANKCADEAECIATSATEYTCRCTDGHKGDGLKDGTGCNTATKVVTQRSFIALATIFAFSIITAL